MNKTVLLLTTALVGVSSFSASFARPLSGPPLRLLWNQNSNDEGHAVPSENLSSSTNYNAQAADDFVIPKGATWKIMEVDVTGVYWSGSGPATSENVVFYKDMNGIPGSVVKNGSFKDLNGGSGPSFSIPLTGNGLKLHSGKYWVSVVSNMDFIDHGAWAWEVNSVQHRNPAVWQNPGDGYATCPTWGTIQNCVGFGPDLMFALKGISRRN